MDATRKENTTSLTKRAFFVTLRRAAQFATPIKGSEITMSRNGFWVKWEVSR